MERGNLISNPTNRVVEATTAAGRREETRIIGLGSNQQRGSHPPTLLPGGELSAADRPISHSGRERGLVVNLLLLLPSAARGRGRGIGWAGEQSRQASKACRGRAPGDFRADRHPWIWGGRGREPILGWSGRVAAKSSLISSCVRACVCPSACPVMQSRRVA